MSFVDWMTSDYPNESIKGQWGFNHILTMIICVAVIISCWLIVRKLKEGNKKFAKKFIICTLVGIIFFFEIMRRVINFGQWLEFDFVDFLYNLLPRPWCAISCWMLIISVLVDKKYFYNFASMSALLCSIIFFAYPGAGFNDKYILFSNLYSIATHALLLVTSILLIIFKFTDFKYKNIWKEAICFGFTYLYAFLEIFVLKIADDPLYFMPGGDIQEDILGIPYGLYLVVYIIFVLVYVNIFYLIGDRKNVKKVFKRNKLAIENS